MVRNKKTHQRIVLELLGTRPIVFNPDLSRVLGSVNAGLFFNQILYWWGKGANPEMIYKTVLEFKEETTLTKNEQLSAQKICVKKGVLEVLYKGIPPKRNFVVNLDKTYELLDQLGSEKAENTQSKCPKSGQTSVVKTPEDLYDLFTHNTESTPEITLQRRRVINTSTRTASCVNDFGTANSSSGKDISRFKPEFLKKKNDP